MLVPIISGLGALSTTTLAFLLPKSNNLVEGNLQYFFSAQHIEIQNRIKRILGSGFYLTFKTISGFGVDYNGNSLNGITYQASVDIGAKENFVDFLTSQGYKHPYWNRDEKVRQVNGWINEGIVSISGGWSGVTWIHAKNPDELCKILFTIATDGKNFSPPITPLDNYKCYNYTFPDVLESTEHFKYFIRCAPEELTCMLFGKTISLSSIVTFFGSAVGTILTGGATTPILLKATENLVKEFTGKKVNAQNALQTATDLVNIYNGADVSVKGGTKTQLMQIATNFVKNNPDLFGTT